MDDLDREELVAVKAEVDGRQPLESPGHESRGGEKLA
jgi:hypothetical protein